jgi:nickel/cobalt exporter
MPAFEKSANARRSRLGLVGVLLAACAALAVVTAPAAAAHPLGNFTVNYYSGIRVQPQAVLVDFVVDRAEIPTLQTFPDARSGVQPAGAQTWRATECAKLAREARLLVAGKPQLLTVTYSRLTLLPGAAGLATSRLECAARTASAVQTVGDSVAYRAAPTGGRVGWHEITARGDGVALEGSTVPTASVSKQLTAYPANLLASPLDLRSAQFAVRAGSGHTGTGLGAPPPSSSSLYGLDRMTSAYTGLVSRTSLTPGFALLALLLSLLLGGLHAFAPGHGKTLMAAYLVARDGTWRQAAVIGLSVTVTHTIGVLVLGVALSAAAIAAPEQVYPWLGLISGVLLAGIGFSLLRTARAGHVHGLGGHTHGPAGHTHGPGGHTHPSAASPAEHALAPVTVGTTLYRQAPSGSGSTMLAAQPEPLELADPARHEHRHDFSHEHEHGHDHSHSADHQHRDDGAPAQTPPPQQARRLLSTWRLAAVGLVGGMVPSPSALLVLLGGIALGRAWFGAILVVAYGIGMATALVCTGLLLVLARDRVERWSAHPDRRALPGRATVLRWTRRLPLLTASTVIVVGAWIALRSLAAL